MSEQDRAEDRDDKQGWYDLGYDDGYRFAEIGGQPSEWRHSATSADSRNVPEAYRAEYTFGWLDGMGYYRSGQ